MAYVIGTFAAHPLLLGAMNQFLRWATKPATAKLYNKMRKRLADWCEETNSILETTFAEHGPAPIQLASYSTVWTLLFKRPGRYPLLLQYYLKDEGVNLSWVGTGRMCISLDFEERHFRELRESLIRACRRMFEDGWWFDGDSDAAASRDVKLRLGVEMGRAVLSRMLRPRW